LQIIFRPEGYNLILIFPALVICVSVFTLTVHVPTARLSGSLKMT